MSVLFLGDVWDYLYLLLKDIWIIDIVGDMSDNVLFHDVKDNFLVFSCFFNHNLLSPVPTL